MKCERSACRLISQDDSTIFMKTRREIPKYEGQIGTYEMYEPFDFELAFTLSLDVSKFPEERTLKSVGRDPIGVLRWPISALPPRTKQRSKRYFFPSWERSLTDEKQTARGSTKRLIYREKATKTLLSNGEWLVRACRIMRGETKKLNEGGNVCTKRGKKVLATSKESKIHSRNIGPIGRNKLLRTSRIIVLSWRTRGKDTVASR